MIVHDPNNTARIKTHDTKSVNEPRLILKYRLEPYSSYYQIFEHTSHMKLYRFSTEILVFFFFYKNHLTIARKLHMKNIKCVASFVPLVAFYKPWKPFNL